MNIVSGVPSFDLGVCEQLIGTKVAYDSKLSTSKRPSMFRSVSRKYSVSGGLESTRFVDKVPNPTTPPIPEVNLPHEDNTLRPSK